MGTVITRPEQVFNAVAAKSKNTTVYYSKATGIPVSTVGKILVKAELAGLLKRNSIGKHSPAVWYTVANWNEAAYAEAHKQVEAEWASRRKPKAGKPDALKSVAVAKVCEDHAGNPVSATLTGRNGCLGDLHYTIDLTGKPAKINVEDLTIAEAKRLYKELQDLFK